MDIKKVLAVLEEFTVEKRGDSFYTTDGRFTVVYKKDLSGVRRVELTCKDTKLRYIHTVKQLIVNVNQYSRPLKRIKRKSEVES